MFSKKPDESPRPAPAPKKMSSGSTFSVIGADVTIKGDISASVDLHIDGTVEGDIECSNLVQGEGSEIHGSIDAESARLSGHVSGSLSARDLVILKSAKIEGDVHYDSLTIEQGADVEGKFGHRVPQQRSEDRKPAAHAPQQKAPTASGDKTGGDDEPKLTLAG